MGGAEVNRLKVLDLFSGIGGFSLGLERTGGFETVAFCEIEEFPRKVLAKHWPDVPCFPDVTKLRGSDVGTVDVICGGFPCQDISLAGLGAGLDGARSGLWSEFARLVGELRPKFVLVENVAALLGRGLDRVLRDLASFGYNAEWHCIPASAVGAPHKRDRLWIIAYSNQDRSEEREHVSRIGQEAARSEQIGVATYGVPSPAIVADAHEGERALGGQAGRMGWLIKSVQRDRDWKVTAEPVLGRGADGIPYRVDRCGALGNAVVPQIPELIGRAILDAISTNPSLYC